MQQIKAELRHRVSVPITKTFFKIVFWSVKPYSHMLFYRNLQPLYQ